MAVLDQGRKCPVDGDRGLLGQGSPIRDSRGKFDIQFAMIFRKIDFHDTVMSSPENAVVVEGNFLFQQDLMAGFYQGLAGNFEDSGRFDAREYPQRAMAMAVEFQGDRSGLRTRRQPCFRFSRSVIAPLSVWLLHPLTTSHHSAHFEYGVAD